MCGLLLGIVLRRRRDSPGGKKTFGRAVISGLRRRRKRRNTWKAGPVMRAPCTTGTVRLRRLRFKYAVRNANVEAGMFCRYSDDTIQAVEMLYADEKINLELIMILIRHIVLNEGVSSASRLPWPLKLDLYALIMRGGFRWNGARCRHGQKIWLMERIDVILR